MASVSANIDTEIFFAQGPDSCSLGLRIVPDTSPSPQPERTAYSSSLRWRGSLISIANLSNVVDYLLERDGLALKDIGNGRSVSFNIDLRSANASRAVPNPRDLATYLLARATATQYVVPFLLAPRPDLPLFRYQRTGIDWLCSKPRAILADDMGLGKTLQAIVALRRLFFSGAIKNALVVCPKSLMSNWESELGKWADDLVYVRMVPSAGIAERAWETVLGSVHVLITTYEQIRSPSRALTTNGFDLLVSDEAHRLRNEGSLTTSGIRKIAAARFWALTGTPIERDTFDLSTLLSIVAPKSCSPGDAKLSQSLVRSLARPFLLRRLKSEVLKQLPPVIESREVLELGAKQRKAYNSALERFSKKMDDRQMLALITQLRSICDYEPTTKESAKAERIFEILSDIHTAGEKVIVFSHLTEPLHLMRIMLRQRFGEQSLRLLLGEQSTNDRHTSVTEFRTLPGVHFLLASSRVGGEGLTITEANHVVFFNEWWNPSSNDQARDRVVRLGQKKGVLVYTFVCRDTIEEALLNILRSKRATFEDVVNTLAESDAPADDNFTTIREELRHSLALYSQ